MEKSDHPKLKIAAVGDISFAGAYADRPTPDVFSMVQSIFEKADIVVGNLEGPLYDGNSAVPGKCTIRGNTGWARILKNAGINTVSLANNHIMDHGEAGLFSSLSALKKVGIDAVGAGANIIEACKPIFKTINGCRIAVLARTSVIVDSPSYAGKVTPGVAFLDMGELLDTVRAIRKKAEAVLLMMHWGVEHYSYPTPEQRKQAKALIEAGVDIIIGHHPHVVQGYERLGQGVVAYSLGNFVFDEFEWMEKSINGRIRDLKLKLTPENRTGIILKASLENGQITISQVFTRMEGNGQVCEDDITLRMPDFEKFCMRLKKASYAEWWKLYAWRKEWDLRFKKRLSIKNLVLKIYRLRPRHAYELFRMFRNSLRITFGKSTNPYE